jgi:hypothetical protein
VPTARDLLHQGPQEIDQPTVEPQHVDLRLDDFKLDVENRSVTDVDIADAIVRGTPELTFALESQTFRVSVQDPERRLLTGDLLTGWTWGTNADDRDEANWITERPRDRRRSTTWTAAPAVAKQAAGVLNFIFEDRSAVALLRRTRARARRSATRSPGPSS